MTYREEIWNKAQKALFEKYGESPDINIVNRLLSEKRSLADYGVMEYFWELSGICRESIEKYNEELIAKAPVHTCLSAYLLGATKLNPLPPHYICTNPKCKRVEWVDDLDNDKCLFDMRHTRTCKCGAEMRIDGYDLPYETYLPYAQRLQAKDSVPVNNYRDLFEVLCKKHFQYSLFGAGQACNLLGQATGVSPDEIDISDREVKRKLLIGDFSIARPKLAAFINEVYEVVRPSDYNELIKIISFAHGTFAWRSNAEELLTSGEVKLSDIPATRDEVFMMIRDALQERGTGFAYDVAEKARKGYFAEHEIDNYTLAILKELGFKDWFASYLLGVRYMSTKALSVLELWHIVVLTWYLIYFPKQYAEVIGDENIWEGGQNNG